MHPSTLGRRPTRPFLGILAVGLLAASLAACSSGTPVPTVPAVPHTSGSPGAAAAASPGANASQDPQDAMLAYAKCMRTNGIDFPDPQPATGGGPGIVKLAGDPSSPQWQAADKACQPLLPNGGVVDPVANQKFQDAMLAYARCMRDHGIDFPDPKFDAGGGTSAVQVGGNLDPNAPAFQTAQTACGTNLPGGGSTTVISGGAPATNP